MTQVENAPGIDYIVGVFYQMPGDGMNYWHRVMNFGERQGDAKDMAVHDLPIMEDVRIRGLINKYDPSRIYKRSAGDRYIIIWRVGE